MNMQANITPEQIFQLSSKLFEFGRGRLFAPEVRASLRLAAHLMRQLLFDGTLLKAIELTPEAEKFIYQAGDLTIPLPPDDHSFLVELSGSQRDYLRHLIEIARTVDQRDNGDKLDRLTAALFFAATKRHWLATAGNMTERANHDKGATPSNSFKGRVSIIDCRR
jgi:hypothetical protein